jgi:hypothetical protein
MMFDATKRTIPNNKKSMWVVRLCQLQLIKCEILGFHSGVNVIFVLLRRYGALIDGYSTMFRESLSALRNIPERQRF